MNMLCLVRQYEITIQLAFGNSIRIQTQLTILVRKKILNWQIEADRLDVIEFDKQELE